MTLNDYARERENVVLFFSSTGTPRGDYTVLGHPALDFAARRNLLGLKGKVDSRGDWNWNWDGSPTDDFGNRIIKLRAYVDEKAWNTLVEEYTPMG